MEAGAVYLRTGGDGSSRELSRQWPKVLRFREAGETDAEQPGQVDPPSVAEKPAKAVPQKLLQINLVARNKAIDGDLLMRVARDLQLEAGEMEIFHRYQGEGSTRKQIFSMASLVEPGTFPFEAMSGFSTPGVTLFAQLPGPCEGQETFEQMLAAAQRLAALLDAEMLDQTRSGLSRQTIEHIKEEIREHSRLVRLARSGR